MAAVVGGGEEDNRKQEGGIVELPEATVRFLLSISLLPNPFSQCPLHTSGPAALTGLNPLVMYTHRDTIQWLQTTHTCIQENNIHELQTINHTQHSHLHSRALFLSASAVHHHPPQPHLM